uniref:Uncharacterized protein n=1 Tax=Rheinheimera sp. BAL341 TaxID=1708203 RepID=A0A486XI74_9GAMM
MYGFFYLTEQNIANSKPTNHKIDNNIARSRQNSSQFNPAYFVPVRKAQQMKKVTTENIYVIVYIGLKNSSQLA